MIAQRVRGSSLWTPAKIATAVWLDASDSASLTTVSGKVSEWRDKSGNARHATQTDDSYRPTYSATAINNAPGLNFNSNILGFLSALPVGLNALTYFACAQQADIATSSYSALFQLRTNNQLDLATLYLRSNTAEAGGRRLSSNSYQMVSTAATSGPLIVCAQFNFSAATLGISINGGEFVYRSGGFQSAGQTEASLGMQSVGSSNNGASAFTPSNAVGKKIGCFIAISAATAAEDRQRIEGYLAHKWGLTANLPAAHPYKVAPPRS